MRNSHSTALHKFAAASVSLVLIPLTLAALMNSANAADPPGANAVERVRPYLQPAVVGLEAEASGIVYDEYIEEYIGEKDFVVSPRDAAVFTVSGTCTGFAVSSVGHIATAGHCVDPKEDTDLIKRIAVEHAVKNDFYDNPPSVEELIDVQGYRVRHDRGSSGPEQKFNVYWDVPTGDIESGKAYPARVLDYTSFEKGDGGLLKTEVDDIVAVSLSDEKIEIGKEIVAIGYPGSAQEEFDKDLKPSYNDGKVSSEATKEGLFTAYELTATINAGMSGGPVADSSGKVIGFNSFNLLDDKPISYARPASFIRELMDGKGVENTLNGSSKAYDAGLDAYFAGNKDRAIEQLTIATEADEDNDVAKDFLKKAEALEGDTNWLLLIGLPLLALVLLAGLVGALLTRRRKSGTVTNVGPEAAATAAPVVAGSEAPETVPVPTEPTNEQIDPASSQPVGFSATLSGTPPGRFCTSCGNSASPGEGFCSRCGTQLPAE
jgi:S1-C subfamily serine protease